MYCITDERLIGDIVIWKRRAELVDRSSQIFEGQSNPDGWRLLSRHVLDNPGEFIGSVFFNGDGNRGSVIRREKTSLYFDERREIQFCQLGVEHEECEPGGQWAAYPAGDYEVDVLVLYNLTQDLKTQIGSISRVGFEEGDSGILAVDYRDDEQLILREVNVESDRGYLRNFDVSSNSNTWLTVNHKMITDNTILNCSVAGGQACRSPRTIGYSQNAGGYLRVMGNYKSDVSERVAYHIFYMNLRTETFAFSRQQDGITNYTAVHDGQLYPLGTTNQATTLSHIVFSNSIYGFQGDERNYSSLENTTNPDTGANEEIYKMNTRLGQYSLSLTSPVFAPTPDEFGLDVSVNGDAFITGRLPSGDTFNVLSNAPGFSLSSVLKRDLTGITVYPIYIR